MNKIPLRVNIDNYNEALFQELCEKGFITNKGTLEFEDEDIEQIQSIYKKHKEIPIV